MNDIETSIIAYRRKKARERMKKYYRENRERITANRRERYRNDPVYREKIKAAHRGWYRRKTQKEG